MKLKVPTKEQWRSGIGKTVSGFWVVIVVLFAISLGFDIYNKAVPRTEAFTIPASDDDPELRCIRDTQKGLGALWCFNPKNVLIEVK